MRKRITRSLTILTLLALAFSVTAWAVSLIRQQQRDSTAQGTGGTKRKTLREVAQERDVEVVGSEDTQYDDLRALAKDADAVIIGRITEARSSFSEDGEFITTYYTVDVQRVLKDATHTPLAARRVPPAALVSPLTVARHGGVVLANGHKASSRTEDEPAHEPLLKGKDYVLFLWWSSDTARYLLAGGISGLVLIEDNMRVKPLGTRKDLKAKNYNRLDLESFINEILRAQWNTQQGKYCDSPP